MQWYQAAWRQEIRSIPSIRHLICNHLPSYIIFKFKVALYIQINADDTVLIWETRLNCVQAKLASMRLTRGWRCRTLDKGDRGQNKRPNCRRVARWNSGCRWERRHSTSGIFWRTCKWKSPSLRVGSMINRLCIQCKRGHVEQRFSNLLYKVVLIIQPHDFTV